MFRFLDNEYCELKDALIYIDPPYQIQQNMQQIHLTMRNSGIGVENEQV